MSGLPIRLRLATSTAALLLIVLAAVALMLRASLEASLIRQTDDDLRLRASQSVSLLEASGGLAPDSVAAAVSSADAEFAAPGIYAEVLDSAGLTLASSPSLGHSPLPESPELLAAALAGQEALATLTAQSQRVRVFAAPVNGPSGVIGVVLVGESLHYTDLTIRRLSELLAIISAGGTVLAFAGSFWLTSRALGPVVAVTRSARRIASTGRFVERLPLPRARDELAELTATFNEMIDRLAETIRRQRAFLADASHELRGPLMVIRGNLDLLGLGLPRAGRETSVREATEEAERMARLVGDLLFLAEGDAREIVAQDEVALDAVVRDVVGRALDVDRGAHDLRLTECDPTTLRGDRDRLAQLLWNLIENSLRYTPSGGEVFVSLRNHGAVAELSVADRGIGISADQLPWIFERFYRADKARSRSQGGTGLGLAIVKQIAEAHRGQVRVRSEPGEGSTFTVVLPTPCEAPPSSSAR